MSTSIAAAAARAALKPPTRLTASQWGAEHVHLPFSARSPKFDPESSPWLAEVLDAVADNSNREIVCYGAVGSSKTTMYEVLIPYIVAEDPGPTLCVMQTDAEARTWAETRLHPVLEHCAPVRPLFPGDRHKKRKLEILFPHMPLLIVGANLSSLQSKSIRWVFLDETWCYKSGMYSEARKRTHDRWNSRILAVSQGGVVGDDMDQAFCQTDRAVWEFKCPDCGEFQPYKWNQVKWDSVKDEEDNYIWSAVADSTRYACLHCDAEFPDTPEVRRSLAASGRYRPTHGNAIRGHRGFQWNVLTVWWVPWGRLAVEWLQANDAKKSGLLDPLRQFIQKRMAAPWAEELGDARVALTGGGYVKADFASGEIWDGEVHRIMTVDKQRDHFWAVVRAWKADGSSRLLWEGKVLTFEMLDELAERYKVPPRLVFCDAGFDTHAVYSWCADAPGGGHTAIHGARERGFRHKSIRGRPAVTKFFSRVMSAALGGGRSARYIFIASDKIKDITAVLRSGQGSPWETPDDLSESYRRQIDGEVKREVVDPKTKSVSVRWVRTRDNHLWDCENYQTAAALMLGILAPPPAIDTAPD